MIVRAKFARLRQTRPGEFAVRFLFGGLCTMAAGLIANRFGPRVGGLFLAFPAIFPAGASLIERHEVTRKQRAGLRGEARGRALAGVDAAGASLASVGLAIFAAVVWRGLAKHGAAAVIAAATACWLVVSVSLWLLRRSRICHRFRQRLSSTFAASKHESTCPSPGGAEAKEQAGHEPGVDRNARQRHQAEEP